MAVVQPAKRDSIAEARRLPHRSGNAISSDPNTRTYGREEHLAFGDDVPRRHPEAPKPQRRETSAAEKVKDFEARVEAFI